MRPGFLCILFAATIMPAGCASSSSVQPGLSSFVSTQSVGSRSDENHCSTSASLLYISIYSDPSKIIIYSLADLKAPCGHLTGAAGLYLPEGLFVDTHENLWVANAGYGNVLEFPKGATSPSLVLGGLTGYVLGVVVDPNDGTVYVNTNGPDPGIAVFPSGATLPAYVLTDELSGPCPASALAIDKSGGVYVAVTSNFCPYGIYKFRKGSRKAVDLGLAFDYVESLETTSSGALALCNFDVSIDGVVCGLVPKGQRTLTNVFSVSGVSGSTELALLPGETTVFFANYPVTEWSWPGPDSEPIASLTKGFYFNTDISGVAVSPPDPPGKGFK